MAEKARIFQDCRAEELIMPSPDPNIHSTLVAACVISTTLFRAALAKMSYFLALLPSSHRTRP